MVEERSPSQHIRSRGRKGGPGALLALCLVLGWVICGFSPQAHANGTLIVGVYSTVDAQPVAGATVTVTENGSFINDAVTPASGEVQFTLAQSLNYTVTASKPGFTDSVRDHVNILDGVLTRLTLPLAPDLPHNGTWQGTTGSGLPIGFLVESSTVTGLEYDVDYQCFTGTSTYWSHQRAPFVPVTLNWFVFQENFDAGVLEGTTFAIVFVGNFTSDTEASGQIVAFVAAFMGEGFAAQPCWSVDTWTATKVAPPGAASSASAAIEYDLHMRK